MTHKVCTKLCVSCEYRARKGAFDVYHCDYASIEGKCRLDAPGTCSHYKRDELYNPIEAENKKAQGRERQRIYKLSKKVKSSRPVGRPKKEW